VRSLFQEDAIWLESRVQGDMQYKQFVEHICTTKQEYQLCDLGICVPYLVLGHVHEKHGLAFGSESRPPLRRSLT
jgi:hypothetical protein